MENTNVAALQELEKKDAMGMKKIERKRILFYASFAGLFLLMLFDLVFLKNEIIGNEEVILEKHEDKVLKNTEIITSVLSYPYVPPRPNPTFVNNSQSFNTIINLPPALNEKKNEQDFGERTYLEDVLIKIVDILSVPLFTKGIVLDMEINEDVFVFVPAEVLEQTLFSFLTFSINNFSENSFDRRIKLKTKFLGSTMILEISNNGAPFGDSFLRDANGLQLVTESTKRLLDLKIGTELIRENLGNVFFENNSGMPKIKVQLKSVKVKNSKARTRIKKMDSFELLA